MDTLPPPRPQAPDMPSRGALASGKTAAHFIAINCHAFHDPATVAQGLPAVSAAAALLRSAGMGRVQVHLFWHSAAPVPEAVRRQLAPLGIALRPRAHRSNGENLNHQIAEAQAAGHDYFYRVDADDAVFVQRFALQARYLERGDCDICGGGLRYEPKGAAAYTVMPPARPGRRDFIENRFVLHPTMAIRLAAFRTPGLRYWPRRLEDKALMDAADAAGLRIRNLPRVLGTYRLTRGTRNGVAAKWLGLRLNMAFLWRRRGFVLMPYALALFAGQMMLGAHGMRRLRAWRYRVEH